MNQIAFDLCRYPSAPGWKATETSKQAARQMHSKAETLQSRTLEAFRDGEYTADEIAAGLKETVLAIRPRVSTLARLGFIEDTGLRRPNVSGHSAIVWRVKR